MPHRRLRWLRRALLAFAALVVVAIVGFLIVIPTDWGRERIRRRVVAMLQDQFPGCLTIGRVDGSVLGDVYLSDVVACDSDGRQAITVKRVRANLGLLALIGG
jgi:autotransporter translocation and assembly factor TamB